MAAIDVRKLPQARSRPWAAPTGYAHFRHSGAGRNPAA